MELRDEIAREIEGLPPDLQEQVLRFVASLPGASLKGETGKALRTFSSLLDPVSAKEMASAIEEACERVDCADR